MLILLLLSSTLPILDPRSIRPPTSTCRRRRAARFTALAPFPAALKPNPPPIFDSLAASSHNTVTITRYTIRRFVFNLRIFCYSSYHRSIRPPSTCCRRRAARCTALALSPAALKPNLPPIFDSLTGHATRSPSFSAFSSASHPLPPNTKQRPEI